MSNPRTEKVFGRYNELVLLFLGFLLTTIVGGLLTSRYQERSRLDSERATRLAAELARATAVSEEVSRLLDRRLYRTRVLLWAVKDHASPGEVSLARDEYRKAIADWNENLNRIYSLVEYSFGPGSRAKLELGLAEHFRSIHKSLDVCVRASPNCDTGPIEQDIDSFNPQIYTFDAQLLDSISQNNVGVFRKQ